MCTLCESLVWLIACRLAAKQVATVEAAAQPIAFVLALAGAWTPAERCQVSAQDSALSSLCSPVPASS